ncbi:unnamed protein product [Eruca vesicaria subsp. sativa]|uniref:NAC domain-containing protein n=1 Tax=Eruca vesicaria subsp. sativa TaxID=29727 RepID=A0ABC8KNR0_ERUVS|nr:unnamed protein product [Eruca vesicaria subsp. sativa]
MADRAHESESEPEFKKQKLEQLQRKAYHSVLLASKTKTSSGTSSHVTSFITLLLILLSHSVPEVTVCVFLKSQIIQKLTNEWEIDQETHIATCSVPNPEPLVVKHVHARSPDDDEDDDSPTKKKIKLHKQAYDHVLHAFNAESPSLSSSRTLIMQDLLEECNKPHIKKIVEPRSRLLPEDLYFRPTSLEMSTYLKQKVLGQPIEACIIPEERHNIFSTPPRDLPGYPEETHWYYYCRKPKGQETQSMWTRFRENTDVLDEEENCVGIKRRFTIVEKEEECNDIFLADEEEPPVEEWFLKEISLPSSVAVTDLVLCKVVLKKRERTKEEEEEDEEEYDEEEEEEEDE